jgi:ribokinase
MKAAVVGHVEWIEFARVERLPTAGEIVHAEEFWEEAAGGGGVASVQLTKLADRALLYTALGDDELGHRSKEHLEALGVQMHAAFRDLPQRRGFTFIEADGERTITTIHERYGPSGSDPLAWDELDSTDAVYFVSGDAEAVRQARRARVLVATARSLDTLVEARVQLDVLVHSSNDAAERYAPGQLDPAPKLVVGTAGASGGTWTAAEGRTGSYAAAPLPGPVVATYGAGDSFAAALTYAMGAGYPVEEALHVASQCAAAKVTGRAPFEGQLHASELAPPR